MEHLMKQEKVFKTVDEFIQKYPPPDYTYLVEANQQTPVESNIATTKSVNLSSLLPRPSKCD